MPDRLCFLFRQVVDRYERPDVDTDAVTEQGVRMGLCLVECDAGSDQWTRRPVEFLADEALLETWRGRANVPLSEMKLQHQQRAARFRLPFGYPDSTEIVSDLLNENPVLLGTPLPIQSLAWIGVLPGFAGFQPKADTTWQSTVTLRCGFGAFKVPYQVAVKAMTGAIPNLEIKIDEKPRWSAGRNVVLILQPSGSATLTLNPVDRLPLRYEGKVKASVRTDWNEEGRKYSLELSRSNASFLFVRIPASFNENLFIPGGWKDLGPSHLSA